MREVCDILEQLVRDGALSAYALGGATAAGFHGEPLATRNIDVFVGIEPVPASLRITLDPLYRRPAEIGFAEFEEVGLLIHGFPVQFLSTSPRLETEALEQALWVEWESHRVRVMRPEHLTALALATGRPKARARLVYLVELPDFDLHRFEGILTRHELLAKWRSWGNALGILTDR